MKLHPKKEKSKAGHVYFGDYGQIDLGFSCVKEDQMGPFKDSLHLHQTGHEYYWTLSGEGILEVEGQKVILSPQNLLEVEPGEKHRILQVTQVPFILAVICSTKDKKDKIILE